MELVGISSLFVFRPGLILFYFWIPTFSAATKSVELKSPSTHYLYSGDLRITYRILVAQFHEIYTANFDSIDSNATVHRQFVTLSSDASFGHIDIPCSLLIWPGDYALKLLAQGRNTTQPEITSAVIRILWLEKIIWEKLEENHTLSTPLTINFTLSTPISCPQQEPNSTSFHLNLFHQSTRIASMKLSWPLVSTQPRHYSHTFPCQLLDEKGAYYASLSIIIMAAGRGQEEREFIVTDPPVAIAIERGATADYGLIIGDMCDGNNTSSVSVAYRAPNCVRRSNDRIRVYRLQGGGEEEMRWRPTAISQIQQVYVMERLTRSRPRFATFDFPCRSLLSWGHNRSTGVLGFCWVYASVSRRGLVEEIAETRQCFPVSSHSVGEGWHLGQGAAVGWSEWGAWTPCTATCRKGHHGGEERVVRMRSRVCNLDGVGMRVGLYDQLCFGPAVQTRDCQVPICHQQSDRLESTGRESGPYVYSWMLAENRSRENATEIFAANFSTDGVAFLYESSAILDSGSTSPNSEFLQLLLLTFGLLTIVVLLFNMALPAFIQSFNTIRRKSKPHSTNNQTSRESRFLLLARNDDPAATPSVHQPPLIELTNLPLAKNSDDISVVSSRPEPNDVTDFEYDDEVPAMLDDSETWPANKLDIQIFATAYEDILKDLNKFHQHPDSEPNTQKYGE